MCDVAFEGRVIALRLRLAAALIVAVLMVCGCVSNPKPIPIEELGGQQRWTASDMVDVAISEADRNRADEHFGLFGKFPGTVATGPVWTKIFIGDPTSPRF